MAKQAARRDIRCYLCGHRFEVSTRTMSVPCPSCHKALKVEDITVKNYLPVNDLQTCGRITITKTGRVVAKRRSPLPKRHAAASVAACSSG